MAQCGCQKVPLPFITGGSGVSVLRGAGAGGHPVVVGKRFKGKIVICTSFKNGKTKLPQKRLNDRGRFYSV